MSDMHPIPVASGFSPTFWATASTALVAFFGLVGVWVRQRVPWRKNEMDGETRMREELLGLLALRDNRITELERQLEKERAIRASERELDDHRIRGLESILHTNFELFRVVSPEKIPEIVERQLRAWELHKERIALEKGQLMAAREEAAE